MNVGEFFLGVGIFLSPFVYALLIRLLFVVIVRMTLEPGTVRQTEQDETSRSRVKPAIVFGLSTAIFGILLTAFGVVFYNENGVVGMYIVGCLIAAVLGLGVGYGFTVFTRRLAAKAQDTGRFFTLQCAIYGFFTGALYSTVVHLLNYAAFRSRMVSVFDDEAFPTSVVIGGAILGAITGIVFGYSIARYVRKTISKPDAQ